MVARRRERDPADLGGRPRDRHDADRLRLRPPRADADRRRRDGGAGALGVAGGPADRFARAAAGVLVGARHGWAAHRTARRHARVGRVRTNCLACRGRGSNSLSERLPRALHANAQNRSQAISALRRAASPPLLRGRVQRGRERLNNAGGCFSGSCDPGEPRVHHRRRRATASAPVAPVRAFGVPLRAIERRFAALDRADKLLRRFPIRACWRAALRWCAIRPALRSAARPRSAPSGARHRVQRWPGSAGRRWWPWRAGQAAPADPVRRRSPWYRRRAGAGSFTPGHRDHSRREPAARAGADPPAARARSWQALRRWRVRPGRPGRDRRSGAATGRGRRHDRQRRRIRQGRLFDLHDRAARRLRRPYRAQAGARPRAAARAAEQVRRDHGHQEFTRASCIAPVRLRTLEPVRDDIGRFRAALDRQGQGVRAF